METVIIGSDLTEKQASAPTLIPLWEGKATSLGSSARGFSVFLKITGTRGGVLSFLSHLTNTSSFYQCFSALKLSLPLLPSCSVSPQISRKYPDFLDPSTLSALDF